MVSLGRYFTTLVNRPSWVSPVSHPCVISACEISACIPILNRRHGYDDDASATNMAFEWLWHESRKMVLRGKLPDERRRQPPERAIIAQGLHPHPGPSSGLHDFDDLEGPEWEEDVEEVSPTMRERSVR